MKPGYAGTQDCPRNRLLRMRVSASSPGLLGCGLVLGLRRFFNRNRLRFGRDLFGQRNADLKDAGREGRLDVFDPRAVGQRNRTIEAAVAALAAVEALLLLLRLALALAGDQRRSPAKSPPDRCMYPFFRRTASVSRQKSVGPANISARGARSLHGSTRFLRRVRDARLA